MHSSPNTIPSIRRAAATLALAFAALASEAATPPDPALIDPCAYATEAEARDAWHPMRDTSPVALATVAGRKALRMPCVFSGPKVERASWDRAVALDLADCRGIRFDFFCTNAAPVSYFHIYFQSGEGWYHTSFHPENAGWNTIAVDKAALETEGRPSGWSSIRTIRISAWRGGDTDTEFFLSSFHKTGLLGAEASVAIISPQSAAQERKDRGEDLTRYAATVASMLDALGIPSGTISDFDVTPERLAKARLAILPYNPALPEAAAEALRQFCASGGKVIACYSVPHRLRPFLDFGAMQLVKANPSGLFAAIRPAGDALPGAPPSTGQRSWNIVAVAPAPGARVVADWFDEQGRPSGHPAIVGTSNAMFLSHVLLPDDPANKSRLLLAMAGTLVPDLWRQAVDASLAKVGRVGPCNSFDETAQFITSRSGGARPPLDALDQARALRQASRALASDKRFAEALDKAAEAASRATDAYCMTFKPRDGEFRAFWCHSAFGVNGMDWDEAIRRLAQSGFNAILPNMLWGGVAFHPSKVLPVHPDVATRGDQVAQCLAACRKHNVQLHVWKVNWNFGHHSPAEFADRMRAANRLQAGPSGKQENWLCPSHPENQKLEADAMVEIVRNYDVDGIHFDYIRYPGNDRCFCDGCRERFQKAAGITIANWPADVRSKGPHQAAWLDWRRSNIDAVVKSTAAQARAIKPGVKISAAVFRNWSTDRDSVGQDWKLWCDNGWLDFVCPMDYTPSNGQFENMVARQLPWAGRVPCYPGIGVSTWHDRSPIRVIDQIEITRRLGTGGFTIFNYSEPEARELLPLLGLGVTAKQ